jgi:methanogenic corrinoid protein MtbC1
MYNYDTNNDDDNKNNSKIIIITINNDIHSCNHNNIIKI